MRRPARTSLQLGLVSLACGAFPSCSKTQAVGLNVNVPPDAAANAAWIEVAAWSGQCPDPATLAGGLPASGEALHIAFPAGAPSPPLGNLSVGSYAFAGVARDVHCGVLAAGCGVVDVSKAKTIDISLASTGATAGVCGAGSTCDQARCVPATDQNDPSIGAGCSLSLVGAGPLGDLLGIGGTLVSAPALAATSQGFLLGYREFDPVGGIARLTLIPIDNGGGAGAPQITVLPGRCTNSPESDATAMAFDGDTGLVVLARAPCAGVGGLDLFQVDPTGAVAKSGFSGSGSSVITLATSKALARAPGGGSFLLAFDEAGQTHVVQTSGVSLGSNAPSFGGASDSAGWVAATDGAVALLAATAGGTTDAGTTGAGLTLQVSANALNLGAASPLSLTGAWGSVAATGGRIFVANDGASMLTPLVWSAFDVGKAMPAATGSLTTLGTGAVLFGDVAIAGDRAFIAYEQPGSISLALYIGVTKTPALLTQISLPDIPRVPPMPTVRDGRLSVAASSTRVAVAWTTAETPGDNETVGGYAVFACTP